MFTKHNFSREWTILRIAYTSILHHSVRSPHGGSLYIQLHQLAAASLSWTLVSYQIERSPGLRAHCFVSLRVNTAFSYTSKPRLQSPRSLLGGHIIWAKLCHPMVYKEDQNRGNQSQAQVQVKHHHLFNQNNSH